QTAIDPACGNGILETGEGCDDGNTQAGDGCSDSCQPDDNSATPGDDRAGYVTCPNSDPALTCGPNQGCCYDSPAPLSCVATREECRVPLNFRECDGPEDCAPGQQCFVDHAIYCGTNGGYAVLCHTDFDCIQPDLNPCINGKCTANPTILVQQLR